MRKLSIIVLALVCVLGLSACGGAGGSGAADTAGADAAASKSQGPRAVITMADGGRIVVQLEPQVAPITCENFIKLAQSGFYDGLTFHRIIPNFMIQGGDPAGNGTGGSGQTIKGEFETNGVTNNISHERGVISMARSADPDSASSQFFICNADAPHLDGQYAAFGHVIEGMDVVDRISAVPTDSKDAPITPVMIQSITIEE